MYRLLVVDDEAYITDGLARMLETAKEHELDIYKAYSARQAMDFLDRTSVDIVITDIQMPGMSGMALLKEIYHRWPSCHVIFFTGHDAFEYAYQAVQYHAVRYILKNEGDEVLLATIRECIQDIDREGRNDELLAKAGEQMRLCLPLLRREFLQKILKGKVVDLKGQADEFKRLEVCLDVSLPVMLLAARIDNCRSEDLSAPVDIVIHDRLKHAARCEMGYPDTGFMVWLIQPLEGESFDRAIVTVKGEAENMQRTCLQSLDTSISFVFDKRPAEWNRLQERFNRLKYIMECRLDRHTEMVFAECEFFWGGDTPDSEDAPDKKVLNRLHEKLPLLAHSMDSGDINGFNMLIDEFIDTLKPYLGSFNFENLEVMQSLNLIFLSFITKHDLQGRIMSEQSLKDFFYGQAGSLQQGKIEQLASIGNMLIEYLVMVQNDMVDAFVDNINRYIYENISSDLSLVTLSDRVYLNPSYLSRRYKEITGKNISDTITEARLNKALRLLSSNQYKIGEIAGRVGYESAAHFSRIFKRQMKMTPQEYRDSVISRI